MVSWIKRVVAPAAAATFFGLFASAASAATVPILSFQSNNQQDVFVLNDDGTFVAGAGASNLTFDILAPELQSPFVVPDPFQGSLALTGFAEEGVAIGAAGAYIQMLTDGRFTISNTGGDVLLTAFVTNALIFTNPTGQTGTTLTGNFAFDGGLLFDSFEPGLYNPGQFSFSLTSITPAATLEANGTLAGFTASGTGGFTASNVPLPGIAWAGMALIGSFGAARRLKQGRRDHIEIAA